MLIISGNDGQFKRTNVQLPTYLLCMLIMMIRGILRFSFADKKNTEVVTSKVLVNKMREQKTRSLQAINEGQKALEGIVWRAGYTNELEMNFFFAHDQPKSQYMLALMNYSELGFKKISNIYLLDYCQYEFEQLKSLPVEERFPLVQARYRLDPQQVLVGEDNIINWLIENDMLRFFDTNAPETQVVEEFINDHIKKPLDTLFWNPLLTAQNSWQTNVNAFRPDRSYVAFGLLRMNIQRVFKRWFNNIPKIYKHKEEYQKSKEQLTKGIKQFLKLIGDKRFAGGQEPSHIDFYLYSIIKAKGNSRAFIKFIEEGLPRQFLGWYRLMNVTCQYSEDRVTLRRVQ